MFYLNSQTPDVKDFKFSKYGLSLIIGQYPTFNLKIGEEIISTFTIDNPSHQFIDFEYSIYYSNLDGKCYEINLNSKSQRLINDNNKNLAVKNHQATDFLISTDEGVPHDEIIDITTLEIRHKFETLIGHHFFETHFYYMIFKGNSKIFCLSTDTYNQLWEFDVFEIGKWTNSKGEILNGEIISIIGVWNNLLLLHITRNKILAINSTGAIEWEIENFLLPEEQLFFPYTKSSDIAFTIHSLLDKQKGKLYLLGSHYLFEIDLQSRQRTVLKDYSVDQNWLFKEGGLHGNYILFSGYKHMIGYPDRIGIIDLLQNEVVWEYKTEGNNFFIRHPVMHEDRLYVRDFKSVLYEFKKTELEMK